MKKTWLLGAWAVNLEAGWIEPRRRWPARRQYPDARLIAVLELLIRDAGRTVSVERILSVAWPNRIVGRDSVSTAVYQLRQLLGDDTQHPRYIRTEARRGYRLIEPAIPIDRTARRTWLAVASAAFLVSAIIWIQLRPAEHQLLSLYVESMDDKTDGALLTPLTTAIDATLLSEMIIKLPGRVVYGSTGSDAAVVLRSELVACDMGPALVVHLLDTKSERFLWSNAYSVERFRRQKDGPSLVTTAAEDISAAFSSL